MGHVTDPFLNESQFLSRIRSALGKTENTETKPTLRTEKNDPQRHTGLLLAQKHLTRSSREITALIQQLKEAALPLGIIITSCDTIEDAARLITDVARTKTPEWSRESSLVAWAHPLVDALCLEKRLQNSEIACYREWFSKEKDPTRNQRREMHIRASQALMGVTSADFCVAGTATLALTARRGQSRSTSLLPSIHVAIIKASQLIEEIKELHAILQWSEDPDLRGPDRSLTLISGPSKTADIEATMIHGAHGPRELYIYVIAGV